MSNFILFNNLSNVYISNIPTTMYLIKQNNKLNNKELHLCAYLLDNNSTIFSSTSEIDLHTKIKALI